MPLQPVSSTNPVAIVAHDVVSYWVETKCAYECPVGSHMIAALVGTCPAMPVGANVPTCHMPARAATSALPATTAKDFAGYWDTKDCKMACPAGSHIATVPTPNCLPPTGSPKPRCIMPA
jgi:hypothetical protein